MRIVLKYILVLVIVFVGTQSYTQMKCEHFKTGKFQNIEEGILKASIERNDSIQIEKHGNKIIKLKIDWLDACTYRLKFIEGNQAFWNDRPENMPTEDLIVRITEIHGNSYTQESKFENDEEFVYKSAIEKIDN